jgi:hypothetical protein
MVLLKIYLSGLAVLAAAVVLNLLAAWLRLETWYSFLNMVSEEGFVPALQSMNLFDYFFLLLIYPGLLGLAAYLVFLAWRLL